MDFVELQQTEHGAAEAALVGRRMLRLLVVREGFGIAEAFVAEAALWSVEEALKSTNSTIGS